jgi:nitric-oxide synthase
MTSRQHEEALAFQDLLRKEGLCTQEDVERRKADIESSFQESNTYTLTTLECTHGARVAWRNSIRCIGRLFWKGMHVIDKRQVQTLDEVFQALEEHIQFATNGGAIRPAITLFPPEDPVTGIAPFRILSHQLLRYAAYEKDDGTILGDPMNLSFTQECIARGWTPPAPETRTPFDLLPVMVQTADGACHLHELSKDLVLEVMIEHPDSAPFSTLGLKWYAVPVISDMVLDIGGIRFPAAPFNGWYMETEIGARNFGDQQRYNQLDAVADVMGFDRSNERTLWRDKALVELNVAVLHSFKKAGVKLVDHHTAVEQHEQFERLEAESGRAVTGEWSWLVPPLSGSATSVFHKEYDATEHKPNFFYREQVDNRASSAPNAPKASNRSNNAKASPSGCPFS